ncbi:MAG: GNAT family N-acetyltransferase [Clostridiaceae bacterium]|nr:GNAT family N-acetyltransferase [Eubacteriales bacterium]
MIILKQIDAENFWDVINLSLVKEQEDLVVSNAVSIAQAYVQPECVPLAIYNDEALVGFAMYCVDRDDGEYWIYRLMIDKAHQNKGYGRQAMNKVIDAIKRDNAHHKIYLGVNRSGSISVHLYESLGFAFNGQVFGKEHIMVLEY